MGPSIGRIVHVTTDASGTIEPAIITRVWSEIDISVTMFPHGTEKTVLLGGIIEGTGINQWQWPPRVDG